MPVLSQSSLAPHHPTPVPAPATTVSYTLPSYEYLSNLVASLPASFTSYPAESYAAAPQYHQHYPQPLFGVQSYQPQQRQAHTQTQPRENPSAQARPNHILMVKIHDPRRPITTSTLASLVLQVARVNRIVILRKKQLSALDVNTFPFFQFRKLFSAYFS